MKIIQLRTNQNLLMGKVELVYWTEISTWKSRFFTVWQIEAEINPPALSPATPTFVFSSPPSQKINQLWHLRKSTVPNAVLLARMCRVTSHPSSSQMGNLCSGARRYSTDIQIVFVALENHRCHTDLSLYIKTYSASMLTMVWCVFRLFTVHPTHIFSTKKPPFYPSFLYLHHERTRPFYLYWHQWVYKSWLVYLNNRWIWGKTLRQFYLSFDRWTLFSPRFFLGKFRWIFHWSFHASLPYVHASLRWSHRSEVENPFSKIVYKHSILHWILNP